MFVGRLAYYLREVNALHPFREGNGRAQRTFFRQPDGVAVIGRRPPAQCRADVLRDIDAGLDGDNKGVLHTAQPDRILAALLAGSGFLP